MAHWEWELGCVEGYDATRKDSTLLKDGEPFHLTWPVIEAGDSIEIKSSTLSTRGFRYMQARSQDSLDIAMTKLPYEFDLLYDIKTEEQLRRELLEIPREIEMLEEKLESLKEMAEEHGIEINEDHD